MILRIVKLTFQPEKVEAFLKIFSEEKKYIEAQEGCNKVELLRDIHSENIFFTYSEWENEQALENYRQTDFFKNIWQRAKANFADKPMAWSVKKM